MTNPLTPEAVLQKMQENLVSIKLGFLGDVYISDKELKVILEYCSHLQRENQELKEEVARLKEITKYIEQTDARWESMKDVLEDVSKRHNKTIAGVKVLIDALESIVKGDFHSLDSGVQMTFSTSQSRAEKIALKALQSFNYQTL